MENSNFLSYFKNITEPASKEQIIQNSTSLINTISLHSDNPLSNADKYSDYLKIAKNPSEDFLYTIKRLISGISGTGLEMRKGFSLALTLLINKSLIITCYF